MLFNELVELYLDDKRNGRKAVRPNTLEGYESAIRMHLTPRWGQVEVESIGYDDVQTWVDSFPEGNSRKGHIMSLIMRDDGFTMYDQTAGAWVWSTPH